MYGRPAARLSWGERGGILVMFLVTLVPTLLAVGLGVDLGLAYRSRARLANAVDAGALAAVRSVAGSDRRAIALRVALANYGPGGARYAFTQSENSTEGTRVEVRGEYASPAYFSRLVGNSSFRLQAVGAALRVPLDLSLVVDAADALNRPGVLNAVKAEAKVFLRNFSEDVDRIGVVGFATVVQQTTPVQAPFLAHARTALSALATQCDSNLEEGLHAAKAELDAAGSRKGTKRYVLVLTDGRPTAFRDNLAVPFTPPGAFDGVVAATADTSGYRGLFGLDGRRVKFWTLLGNLNTGANDSTGASPLPLSLPGGLSVSAASVVRVAKEEALQAAASIRATGATMVVIAIEPQNPVHPLDTPDLELLKSIANVGGIADSTQTQGALFVTDQAGLGRTLDEVAGHMLSSHLAAAMGV